MNIKESEKVLIELSHIAISNKHGMEVHDKIWEGFMLGMEYQRKLDIENQPLDKDTLEQT